MTSQGQGLGRLVAAPCCCMSSPPWQRECQSWSWSLGGTFHGTAGLFG